MTAGFFFLGLACGFVIGMRYFQHQIVGQKNMKLIEKVKGWIAEVEQEAEKREQKIAEREQAWDQDLGLVEAEEPVDKE